MNGSVAGGTARGSGRRLAVAFGLLAVALAGWIATAGTAWSLHFHTDEPLIARWIDQVRDSGFVTDRAYPGGWFELFRVRIWLEEARESDAVGKLARIWKNHRLQDGRVDAVSIRSLGNPPAPDPEASRAGRRHEIQDGRDFNAWLYVLTVLFLYAACLEAGFHPAAAFVSALFFLASAGPLQFVRYCQTDAGLLVSMAFFAWMAARGLRKRSPWPVVAAGFAAGFAVACKFTLFPLLLWCAAGPAAAIVRGKGESRSRRFARMAALAVTALLAAGAGYVAGTPALRLSPAWYLEALRHASEQTYAEIELNLGGVSGWRGATVLRCASMVQGLASMGALPLLWGAFSWGFWFTRRFRRQLAGIPWLLPLYFPFLACCCPFVRPQELLPLTVIFSMGAGLPFGWCVRNWGKWRTPGRVAAVAALASGTAAFVAQGADAAGMLSCFRMRDTRAEAQNWLADAMPGETPVAFDSYVWHCARGVPCTGIPFFGLPFRWNGTPPAVPDGRICRYYVEYPGFEGRLPVRSPATGRLLPRVRDSLSAYEEAVFPVRTWSVSRGTPTAPQVQPPVRLVSFDKPAADAFDVPIGHARPVRVLPDGLQLYDAGGAAGPGAFRAVHTVGKRSRVHLDANGPPRWLVTRMLEGGEEVGISREGLFAPERSVLPAGGAVAAVLSPGLPERLAARTTARSVSKCRMRGDDQRVFCASWLVPTAAEAARELRLAGDPAGALALLRAAGVPDAVARAEAFLAAAAAGVEPESVWTDAARSALEAADRLSAEREALGRTGATLCGVPLGVLDDFARVRTGIQPLLPGGRMPVWLPPGRYELALVLRRGSEIPARLFEGQAEDFAGGETDGRTVLRAPLDIAAGGFLRIAEDAECGGKAAGEAEISWSPVDRTLESAETLRAALRGRAGRPVPPASGS